MSDMFEVRFELSKPRHIRYHLDTTLLQEEILAVDDTEILFHVNVDPNNEYEVPILDLLKELIEGEVYVNMSLILQNKRSEVLWVKEKNGFMFTGLSFSTDYRIADCLIARATLSSSPYAETIHKSNK